MSTFQKPFFLPFKAILPGLIGLIMLATRSAMQRSLSSVINDGDHSIQNLSQKEVQWFTGSVYEIIKEIEETIFASYGNYFSFMLMMFLLNIVFHGADIKRFFLAKKEQKQKIFSRYSRSDERKQFLKSVLKSLLIYSLIYCLYQVIWIALFSSGISLTSLHEATQSPLKMQSYAAQEILTMPGRILEVNDQSDNNKPLTASLLKKKPSLSIGKVMGEVDVTAYSIKLSKDGKTLFVAANFPAALKIIDISDPEYPVVLSSVPLSKDFKEILYKNLLVSPDETKVYISNFEGLEVIDISDFKSPFYLTGMKDNIFFKPGVEWKIVEICEPNLIMSKDKKFLFGSGYGLQVYDISKPTAPVLISSVPSRINSEKFTPSSIALSQDGKTLYYSDGSVRIYNVEDPKDLKVINSFESTKFLFSSMILSNDYKTAFVLSLEGESNMVIQKLDTSDIHSIKEGQVIQLGRTSKNLPVFLNQTPENMFLLIRYPEQDFGLWHNVLVFDPQEERVVTHEKILVKNDISVLFSEDYKKMFVGSAEKLKIVELYLNFPNKNAFTNSSSTIQTLNTRMQFRKTSFAHSNEEILYSIFQGEWSLKMKFGTHRISARLGQFTNLSFYETGEEIIRMVISKDDQKAFLVGRMTVFIINISNPEHITPIGRYEIKNEEIYTIESLLLSRDGKTGFLIYTRLSRNYLSIIDFSDPNSATNKSSIDLGQDDGLLEAVLSKDESTIFLATRHLFVYNVSDHSSPSLLAQLTFLVDQKFFLVNPEVALSPDGKTLFLKDASTISSFAVHIIDVSNVTSPQLKSNFRFPLPKYGQGFEGEFFAVSNDSRILYIFRDFSLMAIDVLNVSSPRYLGAIKIEKEADIRSVTGYKLSRDGRKAYFWTKSQKLHIASLEPVYTTFMKEDVLLLGERYRLDSQVIKMDKNMEYNQLEGEYRFTKFGLVEPRSIGNPNFEDVVIKPAPSWMNFDLKSQVLTVEPKRKNDIGTYKLYYAFSTRLPKDAFSKMNDTEGLFATLLGLGYVDNQLFLTENVGEYEDFILPLQYSYVKEEIYQVLKRYSFETFNEVNIVQSLNIITGDDKLKITTASSSNLKVEINLEAGQGKFLSRYYGSLLPTITNEKSRLVLEGSLKDINNALQGVVIHHKSNELIDGQISVSDRLNPMMAISVKNISRYFNHNLPPGRNETFPLTIQNQFDKEFIYTGRYFQIKLNQQAFSDKYTEVENLNYHLVLVRDNNETVLPTWLSFSDMTLMGTPPESLFDRDFELKLIVKNEFQEFKEPIKLHVRISSSFILNLLLKYSPYILTVLGLYIKANMIYNILAKRRYKNAKDFYVRIGEEITPEVIFPVSFVAEERQEAGKILKFLEKKIGNKQKLLSCLMVHGDKRSKITEMIKQTLSELASKEREELGFYLDGHRPRIRIVDQIIFNTLTMEMLRSKDEKETRIYYEEIKKQWPEFVDWDLENSCFKINDEKFERVLLQRSESNAEKETTSLIEKSNINLDLLKDAILGFAFDCQNISTLPSSVQFRVKEKTKTNFLKRFLKLDLENCPFTEKGKIGYGMTYHKDYNTLYFDGTVKPDIQKKTIVFQITNLQQKILKELWIIGDGNLPENFSSNESEMKGKEYQIL